MSMLILHVARHHRLRRQPREHVEDAATVTSVTRAAQQNGRALLLRVAEARMRAVHAV